MGTGRFIAWLSACVVLGAAGSSALIDPDPDRLGRGEDGGGGGRDGGGMREDGGGPPPREDAGGPPPGEDAGVPPGFDAGPPPPEEDAGGPGTWAPCDEDEPITRHVGSFEEPACSSSTLGCIVDCGENAGCRDLCIRFDPAGDRCRRCLNSNYIACVNDFGCQGFWEELACCVNNVCPRERGLPCLMGECAEENEAWDACEAGIRESGLCDEAALSCFPDTDG